jgi:hypothetical protein
VYVTVLVPIGNTEPLARPAVLVVVAPGQLSVPVGAVYVPTAPDGQVGSSVMLAGHEMIGAVLSTTVTNCVADPVLPCASVAEYVSVVVPTGKLFPEGTPVRVTGPTPGQLSVADPVPNVASRLLTVTPQEAAPGPVRSVIAAGAVTIGNVLSTTVTTWVAEAEFPCASVAEYVSVVIPTGKLFPEATPVRVTAPTPEQLSVADPVPSVPSRLLTVTPQEVAPAPV